jgi:hypothetical protein
LMYQGWIVWILLSDGQKRRIILVLRLCYCKMSSSPCPDALNEQEGN